MIIDHGDGHVPAVLLAFGEDAGGDLLGARGVDVGAVVGTLVLGRRGGGKGGECDAEQYFPHRSLLPGGHNDGGEALYPYALGSCLRRD